MKTGRYSLYQLLNNPEIEQIIIPEIQRDYVWKEQNVRNLLESIKAKYEGKESVELTINANNATLSDSIKGYLSKEYEKLMYSTKIGFIYAYHDPNYPGKFFLIDGQQRITTLYLLLIALYKQQPQRWIEFQERYFAQSLPKLDYRVREVTHDFLIQLIIHELSQGQTPFSQSVAYYGVIYDKDETTKNIWNNYSIISKFVSTLNDIPSFTEYLEHFVEFNFFDTNISAQGERLYLYMNSRGENLSYQETIKSMIISKGEQKLEEGREWEKWQDFFWNNRGDNQNADQGFQNFLKWAVILHIFSFEDPIIKEAQMVNNKLQGRNEIIEDYIRVESVYEKSKQQYIVIRSYIKDNPSFDCLWLKQVMKAVQHLYNSSPQSLFVYDKWLSQETTTIEYAVLLPLLRYLMIYPEIDHVYVKRLAYFLKNKTYNETHAKNPDRAVCLLLEMLKGLPACGDIYEVQAPDLSRFFTKLEIDIFATIRNHPDREKWELYLADFIKNESLEKFLQGNFKCIWKISNTPDEFNQTMEKFINKIYNERTSPVLRQQLLRYGTYSYKSEGGSSNLAGRWLPRYNFISNDDDWRAILNNEEFIASHLQPLLYEQEPNCGYEKWMVPFLEHKAKELFIGSYKYLWEESDVSPRIILLDAIQAGEHKSWHIENILLKERLNSMHDCHAWNWNYKTTVLPFVLNANNEIEEILESGDKNASNYFIDIVFEWQYDGYSKWYVSLGKRNYRIETPVESEKYSKVDECHYRYKTPVYIHDPASSMDINIEQLCKKLISFRNDVIINDFKELFPGIA